MAPISNCLAFFCLVLSATALTIPHFSHNVFNRHRAIAHVEVNAAAPVAAPVTPKLERSLNKRCVPKPSGNSTSSTYSSSATSTSSVIAPVNVAPSPILPTSSSSSSHSSPSPSSTTSLKEASSSYTTPSPTTTPTPTSTYSSPASSPAQTSSASSGGSSSDPSYLSGTQSGQGTFYETGLGACGITNTDSDYIAAVSELLFDSYPNYNGVNPNDNPVCNKKVTASYGGKSVTVAITDRCTGCQISDLDFSPSAFSALADESLGRIDITWVWS